MIDYADFLIETVLAEINVGGELNSELSRDEVRVDPHYDPKQTDMFPDMPKDLKYVGDMGPYTVAMTHNSDTKGFTVYVMDGNEKVAMVAAEKCWDLDSDHAYTVKAVDVVEDYRGQRIALDLYAFLLTHVCTELCADQEQTRDGAKLWLNILKSRRFHVYWRNMWEDYESHRREGEIKRPRDLEKVYSHDGYRLYCELRGGETGFSSHDEKPFRLPYPST